MTIKSAFSYASNAAKGINTSAPSSDAFVDFRVEKRSNTTKTQKDICYLSSIFIQASLPHSKVYGASFERSSGWYKLGIYGENIPYGTIPRMILIWITTECLRTQSKILSLGNSITDFVRKIGLYPVSGSGKTNENVKDQLIRLIKSNFIFQYSANNSVAISSRQIISDAVLNFEIGKSSTITIDGKFYEDITKRPVPIDFSIIQNLSRSPLSIDIYCWLTYRMKALRKPLSISIKSLMYQFGSSYSSEKHFKSELMSSTEKILKLYVNCKIEIDKNALTLYPSQTSIKTNQNTDSNALTPTVFTR